MLLAQSLPGRPSPLPGAAPLYDPLQRLPPTNRRTGLHQGGPRRPPARPRRLPGGADQVVTRPEPGHMQGLTGAQPTDPKTEEPRAGGRHWGPGRAGAGVGLCVCCTCPPTRDGPLLGPSARTLVGTAPKAAREVQAQAAGVPLRAHLLSPSLGDRSGRERLYVS